ncbi:024L [Invertebrate iridescent virus Kaz2018]|nr:024L [Invertebrate iridescent virus Kaz2018]
MMFNKELLKRLLLRESWKYIAMLKIHCLPFLLNYQRNGLNETKKVYFVKRKHSEQSFWITIKTITELTALIHLKWQSCGFYQI